MEARTPFPHLTALLYTERSQAPPSALNAFDKLYQLCNEIVVGSLPWYVYIAWTATSLSAVNKLDPASLAEGNLMDCRPVVMVKILRKVVTCALFDLFLQDIIASENHRIKSHTVINTQECKDRMNESEFNNNNSWI